MGLFKTGDFHLSSGARSRHKIECDCLDEEDIRTIAMIIHRLVGPFSSVEGVPRGGLRLAEALRPFQTAATFAPHLIVDDVLTTGGSMERCREEHNLTAGRDGRRTIGAVIFARGECPAWVQAVFSCHGEMENS